jgi:hypothetical protein
MYYDPPSHPWCGQIIEKSVFIADIEIKKAPFYSLA